MTTRLSDSRLSNIQAELIFEGFEEYIDRFGELTRRAPERFENRDWLGAQTDALGRLRLYSTLVERVTDGIKQMAGPRFRDPMLWVAVKAVFSGLITRRQDWELAETFFNSVSRRVFDTVGVDAQIEFVDTDFDNPPTPSDEPVYVTFERRESTAVLIRDLLTGFRPSRDYADLESDVRLVSSRVEEALGGFPVVGRAEFVRSPFYRGQALYLVGLLYSGSNRIPIVVALRHGSDGVFVDALLLSEDEVSILFSFTRSYFHVDVARPHDLVRFLGRLMPRKRTAELYIAVGHNKHGKTELYRDLLRHVRSTTERFEPVPGTKGLVMIVFGMPGHDDVFKVIRDTFPHPKRTTRREVMENYRLVFQHDRAGRLMDVQDFQHLAFDKSRFEESLLDELLTEAASTVRLDGDSVVMSHVYVERRIIPLDLFVREASYDAAASAVCDYGQAIKDLATTNIFPGDLLTKNFGVTRHGRVVFYDYDELCSLTDVRIRRLPEARDDHEELSAEPWFAVEERDVFPEEHERFLGLSQELRSVFMANHSDLFDPEPWRRIQQRVSKGELIEVFPYEESARLPGTEGFRGW